MSEWLALVQQEVFYKAHLNFTQTSIDVQRWLSTCSLPCRQADFCNNQGEIKATSVLQSHSISDRKKWDMSLIKNLLQREICVFTYKQRNSLHYLGISSCDKRDICSLGSQTRHPRRGQQFLYKQLLCVPKGKCSLQALVLQSSPDLGPLLLSHGSKNFLNVKDNPWASVKQ